MTFTVVLVYESYIDVAKQNVVTPFGTASRMLERYFDQMPGARVSV